MEDSIIKSFPKSTYKNNMYTIPITEKITLSIDSNMKDIYAWAATSHIKVDIS